MRGSIKSDWKVENGSGSIADNLWWTVLQASDFALHAFEEKANSEAGWIAYEDNQPPRSMVPGIERIVVALTFVRRIIRNEAVKSIVVMHFIYFPEFAEFRNAAITHVVGLATALYLRELDALLPKKTRREFADRSRNLRAC